MNIRLIKSSEKKEILNKLNNNYGITSLPFLLIESGKEKVRGYTGHLSKEEILDLTRIAKVEVIGLYLFKKEKDNELRLSFEAPANKEIQKQLSKNTIELNEEQSKSWMKGNDIEVPCQEGYVVLKHKDDFLGCGKSNGKIIFNHVPKDRRVRR